MAAGCKGFFAGFATLPKCRAWATDTAGRSDSAKGQFTTAEGLYLIGKMVANF